MLSDICCNRHRSGDKYTPKRVIPNQALFDSIFPREEISRDEIWHDAIMATIIRSAKSNAKMANEEFAGQSASSTTLLDRLDVDKDVKK